MRLTLTVLLAALTGVPLAALGQEPPWYDVEIIVFAYTAGEALEAEAWPDDPELPDLKAPRPLGPAAPSGLTAFQSLPASERRLNDTYRRLRTSSQTEPLAHLAWRQPGLERGEAVPVRVRVESDAQATAGSGPTEALPRLDGSVTLILSRYLHLATDLVYRVDDPNLVRESRFSASTRAEREPPRLGEPVRSGTVVYDLTTDRGTGVRELVIRDSRRMRSGELHYLDHPVVGVLVLATPFQPEEKEKAPEAPPAEGAQGGAIRR